MSSRRLLFFLLGGLTLLRLILIGVVELSPDEAYYTMWSQHPDVSYYSKGPGVAATIWLSTHIFGVNEFGIRFFSPLLALGTTWLMYAFARRLYGESVAFWAVLTLSLVPIYQAGAVLMTIDPLSLFFWMAALFTFWRALEEAPRMSGWWPATGAMIGLGFLCKWINAMQLFSIVLLLAWTKRHRSEFRRPGFWIMLVVFLLFMAPPVVWNAQHDWITLIHLKERGGFQKSLALSPLEFLKFLGAHFGVYSPLVFGGMLYALWRGGVMSRVHFKPRFLFIFAAPVLVLYFSMAFREAGEPNWTAPATLSLGLLAVAIWHELAETQVWARGFAVAALAVAGVMSIVGLDSDAMRLVGAKLPYEFDPSARLHGWKSSAEWMEAFRQKFEVASGHSVFLIANKYQTAAALGLYLPDKRPEGLGHPPLYIPESQALENEFSFWPRYDELEDLVDVGQGFLDAPENGKADPALRQGVADALTEVKKDDKAHPSRAADARRHLVQMLQRAMPNLQLDESFVEEQGPSLFAGRDALYITDRGEERAPSTIKGGFERVEMIACVDLERRNEPLRQWRVFVCYNYHGMSL